MSKHCDICNVDFIDDYSYEGHLTGKKHKRNEQQAISKKQLEENSIFLSTLPRRTSQDDIIVFFSQFGEIKSFKFGHSNLVVEYTQKQSADFLLNNPIYFHQWKLNIKKRKLDYFKQRKHSPKRTDKHNTSDDNIDNDFSERVKIYHELILESTWQAQVEKFIAYIQNDEDKLQTCCNQVCESLNAALEQSFPHGRAIRFGSTVTGLHLKQSDTDVFYDIGEPIYDDDDNKIRTHDNRNQGWTPKSIFKQVKFLLYRNKSVFSQVVPIPLAKMPVIKFQHIPTNIQCDISFKHKLGVYNSQLIKYYLSLDTRLKPLMMIIKYWAKSIELSGTGKMTHYSLIMAIIFYLQQPDVNLLPTVKELQSSCEPVYDSGWLVSFDKNIVPDTSNNESSIPELLHGFYKFYSQFKFNDKVLCPLNGLAVSKNDFEKVLADLGTKSDEFTLRRWAYIQDPFQLNHNIAEGWNGRLIQAFQNYCNDGVQLCESAATDNYTSLLPYISDPILKQKLKSSSSIYFTILPKKFYTFGLPDDFDTNTDFKNKDKYRENNWFGVTFKLIEKIFIDIFKFDVQMMYDGINVKQLKVDEDSDVHTKVNDQILFTCQGKYCLNRSRKNRIPLLDPALSCIEKEALISDKIMAEMMERKEESMIKFICTLQKKTNPLYIFVTLTNEQSGNKSFIEIGSYMRSKIPNIIDKELLHMVQYNKQL